MSADPGHAEQAAAGTEDGPTLLEVSDLVVTTRERRTLISGISFEIGPGEIFGLVGESGSGKTLTALAAMGLLPEGLSATGRVSFEGINLLGLSESQMRNVRGRRVGMIFQEPVAALNPVFTVGSQIETALRAHRSMGRRQARDETLALLERVRIPNAAQRIGDYPHQFSGGMCQRIMIAMAIAGGARLLIADEPTTALDVTIQHEIVRLLNQLVRDDGLSVLFISHDLGLVAQFCDRVAVAYAGELVETGPARTLLADPRHPYTQGLVRCVADMDEIGLLRRGIPGSPPLAGTWPTGCRFRSRCSGVSVGCERTQDLVRPVPKRQVRCWVSASSFAPAMAT